MEFDLKSKAALLAAVSALGLSLGLTLAAPASADDESPKEELRAGKPQSTQTKGGSTQFKFRSNQSKSTAMTPAGAQQVKGGSNQMKIKGGQQVKGDKPQ